MVKSRIIKISLFLTVAISLLLVVVPEVSAFVYNPFTLTTPVVQDPDGNCNRKAGPVSASVTEDRSWYLTEPWIGGNAQWDDQIGFSGSINGSLVYHRAQPASAGCRTEGWVGVGYIGITPFSSGSGDTDTFTFVLEALQKRNVGSAGNKIWGQVEYGYTKNNCVSGQITVSNSCQNISGNINVVPSPTCVAPCNATVNWSSQYATGVKVYKQINGGAWQVISNGPTSGSLSQNGLPVGTYTYQVNGSDGFGTERWLTPSPVTVTVTPPAVKTATLSVSNTQINLNPGTTSGGNTVSNTDSTNGGSFTVQCAISPGSSLSGLVINNCPGSLGPNASGPMSVTLSSTPSPGSYSANVQISATGQGGTIVSGSPQNVTVNYVAAAAPTASLTASGGGYTNSRDLTVPVGTSITYNWSSTNANSGDSTFSTQLRPAGNPSCGSGPWSANGTSGSISGTTDANQPACDQYTLTYTARNSSGAFASDSVLIKVVNTSVNGQCATPPHGGTYASAPSGPLCSSGSPSPSSLSGSGPWNWTCSGAGGGSPASCSANQAAEPPVAPPGAIALGASPRSGNAPLNNVSLTAVAPPGAFLYLYYFYCDRPQSDPGGTIAPGFMNGQVTNPSPNFTPPERCHYPSGGTYRPKVKIGILNFVGPGLVFDWREAWDTVTVVAAAIDYNLSNSGTSNATKSSGDVFTQNTITKTLLSGGAQPVTLTLSGTPSGVSHSISNNPCSPTCSSVITFTVTPSAPVGTYPITVTGAPLGRQTNFNLAISGTPMSISCAASPSSTTVGQNVTWTGTVSGGTPPLSYSWSGTNIPSSPSPNTNPFGISYSTTGQKTATLTVTDAAALVASCPPATAQINFNPQFNEF